MNERVGPRDWNHDWFGFWNPDPGPGEIGLDPHDFIDPTWSPVDKEQLVSYIERCPIALSCASGDGWCAICFEDQSGTVWQSDDVLLWPMGLSHYLRRHHLVLPDRFVDHIRRRNYLPPRTLQRDERELPWPPMDASDDSDSVQL